MPAPFETHRAQLRAILSAWGMPEEHARGACRCHGRHSRLGRPARGRRPRHLDDPGLRRSGRANMAARPRIIRETAVSALIDGGGGLGHVPAKFAMQAAIDKARQSGIAITAVRNSAHFGATGYNTRMAAEAGLIGMACTSNSLAQVAPTFGKEAKLGTDPWSFAAPTGDRERPFLLDMATPMTYVAGGRQ